MQPALKITQISSNIVYRVFFIRHAESMNNYLQTHVSPEEYEKSRVADPDLSVKADLQILSLLRELDRRGVVPDGIYCSCLLRALRTAEKIWAHFKDRTPQDGAQSEQGSALKVFVLPDLSEKKMLYEKGANHKGNPRSWFEQNFPDFVLNENITEDGWNPYPQYSVESDEQSKERARRIVEWLRTALPAEQQQQQQQQQQQNAKIPTYFVITHGNFQDDLFSVLLGRADAYPAVANTAAQYPVRFLYTENTAVTRFDVSQSGQWIMRYLNDFQHLETYNLQEDILKRLPEVGGSLHLVHESVQTDQGLT